ncbi:ABC transporter substrate-binding protein [Falsiroseomonas tokyonensis]|uniref:ABC transporter substrate-binding protein n=1 Tax=Falsiroseomonas tokyonensis TaxID=430521 RepID=A0ABV7C3E5_9PROT|nr:ABC transporter substrate-binding protein [Falsiroseomonas tokyonensis]MBU8541165.1 ABC transporter substrate-binding protein [Falsiroseomonas tokyonensis]
MRRRGPGLGWGLAAGFALVAQVAAAPMAAAQGSGQGAGQAAAPRLFRMATSVDAATLDPHATNALFTYLVVSQVYETLTHRADDLKVQPGLALAWEQAEPTRWRFRLRPNVRFAGGEAFNADDVVFSITRALAPTSNYGIYVDTVASVVAVDDLTVDVITRVPDPVVPDKLTRVLMMDRGWSEANRAAVPQNFAQREESFTVRNANGTGPYVIRTREVDQRTVMVRNPSWWGAGETRGNVGEYHHVTLNSDATRVAALLSGEVDMVHVVPVQDVARIQRDPRLRILQGQENRTVWLGLRQDVAELEGSDVRGRNPFKDLRVRQAIAHALDMEAMRRTTLRGQGVPTASMWTQFVNGWSEEADRRLPYDPAKARALLAEAGYPNGFSVPFECPTGTYDEACQAVAGMLARVGIRAQLNIQPNAQFSQRIRRQEPMMYALSWGVPTFDASYTIRAVMASRAVGGAATWNAGGWSNAEFDALIPRIDAEQDPEARRGLIRQAHALHNADLGHIPMYHMMIPWAHRAGVAVTHRADNQVQVREIRVD